MKILILSCNTGQGHNTAGRAILEELNARGIPTWIRRVIVTGVNDTAEDNRALFALKNTHPCVENYTKHTSTHHLSPNSPPHNTERTPSIITRFGVLHFFQTTWHTVSARLKQ